MKGFWTAVAAVVLMTANSAGAQTPGPATIRVDATRIVNRVSPLLTGACIEDVNHEIYGGLYSQMIFGESFQEPPPAPPLLGFHDLGGRWTVRDGVLEVAPGDGPKLIWEGPEMADGAVGVEILFTDQFPGNAGLILSVENPEEGADAWTGYEISLDQRRDLLILGKHRRNWEPLKQVSCPFESGQWVSLVVRRSGNTLSISVDGREVLAYEDLHGPLTAGAIGLRAWQRHAMFRNMWVEHDGRRQDITFQVEPGAHAAVSGMWRPFQSGSAKGTWRTEFSAFHPGRPSQQITFESGDGSIGIENAGLNRWGMHFAKGKPYEGALWVRSERPVSFAVALQSREGNRTYAKKELRTKGHGWEYVSFKLTPDTDDTGGRFAISLNRPGSIVLGYASLQKGAWGRYKGLPVRKDVADGLKAAGFTVLRYGGCMANAPEYRWKNMVGPRDRRRPYRGYWYPHSSNGWGIVDFMTLSRAMGVVGIPDLSIDESPEDLTDFVEYMTGAPDSEWGRKRVADGYGRPFDLPYIQLGNEEAVDEAYWQRFKPLAEAIWKADPDVRIIVGDFAYAERIADPYSFRGAPRITSLAAHKKILDLAKQHNREVWFDIHIWNGSPKDPDLQLLALRDFIGALEQISPGAPFKVCVLEENANNHTFGRALAHAKVINDIQRIGDRVQVLCAANGLQPDGQNDNGWDQGLLFLSPSKVWAQPSYYVTQMLSRPEFTQRAEVTIEGNNGVLDVTARLSQDGRSLLIQVLNREDHDIDASFTLHEFIAADEVMVVGLTAPLDARNTANDPDRVVPVRSYWDRAEGAIYRFPARSFTTLEFRRR